MKKTIPLKFSQLVSIAAGVLILSGAGVAGQIPVSLNHPLAAQQPALRPLRHTAAFPETLRVLAAMVQFQQDNEPRTTGDGTFDLSVSAKRIMDPPPHDRAYTVNHMEFAKNYFRKASNGKLILDVTVLDNIYTLGKPMASYSPPRSSAANLELGNLANDAWHTVDSVTPGIDFSSYGAFLVFHAGVGRDIDLTAQLGYDPGPFDIPSIYLNLASMKKMFGESYQGIPVSGGAYVTNSIIIPETESRLVSTGLGSSLLELGINGLIVASIGSYKDLPDLFNTKTGRSGIGRFGLMDGQSIFSWSGLFPPEPSAWEKYYLGWIDPVEAQPGSRQVEFPAVTLTDVNDTVYRVPISSKEYFLVENRNRDAHRDGATVTIIRNGEQIQKTFYHDTTYFNALNQDSLWGLVTDVDEFDWSLPGATNSRTGELFDGGLLIWHIDENVIDAGIASDQVNADPGRRGVNLMEADGSQDIGMSYSLLQAGFGSEDGTQLDYWYSGNQATPRILSNEFSPVSFPGSQSNDRANSHITIKNFSVRGPRMTATIQLGDASIAPMGNFPVRIGPASGSAALLPADLDGDGLDEFVVSTAGGTGDHPLLAIRQTGGSFLPGSGLPVFASSAGASFGMPVAVDYDGNGKLNIATYEKQTSDDSGATRIPVILAPVDSNGDGSADVRYQGSAPGLQRFVIADVSTVAWFGDSVRSVSYYPSGHATATGAAGNFSAAASYGVNGRFVAYTGDSLLMMSDLSSIAWRVVLPSPPSGAPAVGDLNLDDSLEVVALTTAGDLYAFDRNGALLPHFPVALRQPVSSSPAIADIDGDGKNDIVVTAGRNLYAVSSVGVFLDNFPYTLPTSAAVVASPVVGDIDGDGRPDIIVGTMEGLLVAVTHDGRMVNGFPLQTGGAIMTSAALFMTDSAKVGIAVASGDGTLNAWRTETGYQRPKMSWPMAYHDVHHSGFQYLRSASNCSTCGSSALNAYNWPNPVRAADGYRTHIRYHLAVNARVTVKIFDMAGDLVAELSGDGVGGVDNEIEWNVRDIQSGVYFAHVDAPGTSDQNSVIKIAVVK